MNQFMAEAIREAERGIARGHGGPFGAVVVRGGKIVGRGHNQVIKQNNPTAHSEIVAIADAGRRLKTHDLAGCDIYMTGEPCVMCLCATMWANIDNVYYGCTLQDNENIGFRDEKFEIALNIDRSRVKFPGITQLDRDHCVQLFERYRALPNRKTY